MTAPNVTVGVIRSYGSYFETPAFVQPFQNLSLSTSRTASSGMVRAGAGGPRAM